MAQRNKFQLKSVAKRNKFRFTGSTIPLTMGGIVPLRLAGGSITVDDGGSRGTYRLRVYCYENHTSKALVRAPFERNQSAHREVA